MTLVRSSFFQFIGSAGIADRRQPFKVATDRGETPCELRIAAAQRGISVNTEVAREIDRHEQDVAKLVLDACRPFTCRLLQLGDFLGQLVPEFIELTPVRSEEHTSELQSLMRISYAVFCLKTKNKVESRIKAHKIIKQSIQYSI